MHFEITLSHLKYHRKPSATMYIADRVDPRNELEGTYRRLKPAYLPSIESIYEVGF